MSGAAFLLRPARFFEDFQNMPFTPRTLALSFALVLPTVALGARAAESYELINCSAATVVPISASKEITLLSIDSKGIARSVVERGPFDNMTFHCAIALNLGSKVASGAGFCRFLDPDGDYLVGQITPTGPGKGTWTFLHGTGKWSGISGGGEYASVTRAKPIAAGTSQGCARATGTFELKK
jgi:hypothetical protein